MKFVAVPRGVLGADSSSPLSFRSTLIPVAFLAALALADAAIGQSAAMAPLAGIAIATPADGAKVANAVIVRVCVGNSIRIASAEFRIDGVPFATDALAPFGATLNTSTYSNGAHVLSVQAQGPHGEIYRAQSAVVIDNASATINVPANPPVATQQFVSPPVYVSSIEGEVVAFPVILDNPNNALNTITAQSIVNGVPSPLLYNQSLNADTRVFHWWTTLGQAGTHVVRFHAQDTAGATADRDVTFVIQPRQPFHGPILRVRATSNAPQSTYFAPGSTYEVREGSPQVVMRVDLTPSAGGFGPVSVLAAGLPPGLQWMPSTTQSVGYISGYPTGSSAGTYEVSLISRDASGRLGKFRFSLLVRDVVQAQEQWFLLPTINGAAQQNPVDPLFLLPMKSVAGTVQFRSVAADKGGVAIVPQPGNLKVVYRIDDVVVSPPLSPSTTFSWDSTTVPDGTHALNVELVDADTFVNRLQTRVIPFGVENTASPPRVDQAQVVPTFGPTYRQVFSSQRIDRLTYTGELAPIPSHPCPVVPSVPPSSAAEALSLRSEGMWFGVPILHAVSGLYEPEPRLYRVKSSLSSTNPNRDKLVVHPHYARGATSSEAAAPDNDRIDWWCGTRGSATVSPFSSFVPNPVTTGFLGIDVSGRFFKIAGDGQMTTLAGMVNRRAQPGLQIRPPYLFTDASIPMSTVIAADKDVIGNFNGVPFSVADDLAVSPGDPNVIYVADMMNDRIAKIDLTGSTTALVNPGNGQPNITTFAGSPTSSQHYVDGPIAQARFNRPTSLIFDDNGDMIVSDRDNCAIRKIIMNGPGAGTVVTLAGGSLAGPVPPAEASVNPLLYPPNVPGGNATQTVADWIHYPQCVRVNSQGRLIVSENLTKVVKEIDLVTGIVKIVRSHLLETTSLNDWTWVEVDRHGLVGPVDDIFVPLVGGLGNSFIWRMSADGLFSGEFLNFRGVFPLGNGVQCQPDLGRHYPWAIVIDDHDAQILTTGMGSTGPLLIRRNRPSIDPEQNDRLTFLNGETIHWLGTVPAFPMNSRPSFVATHGPQGYTRLGTILNFDDYAAQYLADTASQGMQVAYDNLANAIRGGFGGNVLRPELTGRDMRSYVYFVLRNSLYAATNTFAIPDVPPDARMPEVRRLVVNRDAEPTAPGFDRVTVSWWTDEPTVGTVTLSPDGVIPACRMYEIENVTAPATVHTHVMRFIPASKDLYFTLTVKDVTGNTCSQTF